MTLTNDSAALTLRAELPKTAAADDALELVRAKVLRGLSIEFRPKKFRYDDGDRKLMIIEEADLRNVSVVDRPAYRGSRVDQRSKQEGDVMDESTVTALIEDALKKRGDDDKLDTGALVLAITEAVNAERPETDVALREQIDSALLERDEARAAEPRPPTTPRSPKPRLPRSGRSSKTMPSARPICASPSRTSSRPASRPAARARRRCWSRL